MGDMAVALKRANGLLARAGTTRVQAHGQLARRSMWAFFAAFLLLSAIFAGYAIWLKLGTARSVAPVVVEKTVKPAPKTAPVVAAPVAAPTPVPRDPAIEEAFDRLVLNGFRENPPRVIINGKMISIGSDLLPGLTLKDIQSRTVIAEDKAGAIYRRAF